MSIVHRFQPYVELTLRDDGRYDAVVEWSDSQIDSWDNKEDIEITPDTEASQAASLALDAWIKKTGQPGKYGHVHRFIVDAPTPEEAAS